MSVQFVPGGKHFDGMRVTILGFARQGIASARFFLSKGACVLVSDMRSAEQLATTRSEIEQWAQERRLPVPRFVLGEHPERLLDETDLLCLSGGVSPAIPIVQAAAVRGIPRTNDALLTLSESQVPVIGITGSAGKTTTTTLVGLMLSAAGYHSHVGGNIGTPLVDRLDSVRGGDKLVMELSSFQLELFDRSPAVAAVLNITPNHLDRHPSMSHYAAAKARILSFQEPGNTAVLNADDPYTGPWLASGRIEIAEGNGQPAVYEMLRSTRVGFSVERELASGAFLAGDRLLWRQRGQPDLEICRRSDVRLRGQHNIANILAASCLAAAAGANVDAMRAVATTFTGVEHRLELVREQGGVTWVNDSIATTPERAVAAIRSFSEPIVLLAGGRDKHLPWGELAGALEGKVRRVILFGEAQELIASALARQAAESGKPGVPVTRCEGLADAVAAAHRLAQPGEVVLLAPGGTSFDAYEDFAARGRHFRALVEGLA